MVWMVIIVMRVLLLGIILGEDDDHEYSDDNGNDKNQW